MAFMFRINIPTFSDYSGKKTGPLVGLLCVLAVSGCSFIEDRTERYVNAPEAAPLELPESAEETRFSQLMPVRDVTSADAGRMYVGDLPEPPDMTSEILQENYVVEVVDDEIWLLVNDVPGRLWPAVNTYMNQQGLGVAYDNPQLGLLQSEIVNYSKRARALVGLSDEPANDEKLMAVQAKVAPGVRRKTTEIQFRSFSAGKTDVEQLVAWENRADRTAEQLETSRRLLTDLSDFLKSREDSKSYSRAALNIPVQPLVRLVTEGEVASIIAMDLDYGRSWGEVRRALDEAGIPVIDLNREEGYFFVDGRSESEKDPGWFSWFRNDSVPVHTHDLLLEAQGDTVVVTAEKAADYNGNTPPDALLNRLFEYLY